MTNDSKFFELAVFTNAYPVNIDLSVGGASAKLYRLVVGDIPAVVLAELMTCINNYRLFIDNVFVRCIVIKIILFIILLVYNHFMVDSDVHELP